MFLVSATGAVDGFQGAFGIGIATLQAVTAGIASVPTPLTDARDENWIFWHPISLHASSATRSEFGNESIQRIIVDSKAMRKTPQGVAMYAAMEVIESGTASMSVFFDSRQLFKLS